MKNSLKFLVSLLLLTFISCTEKSTKNNSTTENKSDSVSLYSFSIKDSKGELIDLRSFTNKKIMFVNVASKCKYTPQYSELETLYQKYKDKLVIIGFPCNDFGAQEPGTSEEVVEFCKKNYGVSFLIAEKITLKENTYPLYKWLASRKKEDIAVDLPSWNFGKYIVNEKGEFMQCFSSAISPLSKEIIDVIESK